MHQYRLYLRTSKSVTTGTIRTIEKDLFENDGKIKEIEEGFIFSSLAEPTARVEGKYLIWELYSRFQNQEKAKEIRSFLERHRLFQLHGIAIAEERLKYEENDKRQKYSHI